MKKISTSQTETYEFNEAEGIWIDILNDGNSYTIWMYHDDNNEKVFLFSLPVDGISNDAVPKIVENVLEREKHLRFYNNTDEYTTPKGGFKLSF